VGLRSGLPSPSVLLLGPATLVLTWLVTQAWVRHNLAIYRRKGPRRGRSRGVESWTHDRLGRPLGGRWPADVRGREVVVDVITTAAGVIKEYRAC
ncbi:MAG: hypothetical protein ACYCO3_12390, partial [Mycobacteriales bacterium]